MIQKSAAISTLPSDTAGWYLLTDWVPVVKDMREKNEWERNSKHIEDCERVEEIIIKGCERVWIKIMLNKKSWIWKDNGWNEDRIIWWDCQICQVQERSNYFHKDKEHFKSKCKRMGVGIRRLERLLRELNIWGGRCVRLFPERRCCWRTSKRERKCEKTRWKWKKKRNECVFAKYIWWKGSELIVKKIKSKNK